MKYRIKITTYQNGRQEFSPQVKGWFRWKPLNLAGEEGTYQGRYDHRSDALRSIDNHFSGNSRKHTIEFEYITKP